MASEGEEVIAQPAADVIVLPDGELDAEAAEIARLTRAVRSVAVDYSQRSLRAKMGSADKLGARWAILFDGEDAKRRAARLRDLASGEQIEIRWEELPDRLS